MKLIKVFSLSAVAALAAMAFVSVSAAMAEPDEITLCLKLVTGSELCPAGQLAPKDTVWLLLAKEPKLITSSGTITCEDSTLAILTLAEVGSPLPVDLKWAFGKLPTPNLGEGCATCTGGIHSAATYSGEDTTTGVDEFWLLTSGSWQYLNCFGFLTCEYGGHFKFKIDRDATIHPALEKAKGDLILVQNKYERTGGSGLCPASAEWVASYTGIGCDLPTKVLVDCWIALDNKV